MPTALQRRDVPPEGVPLQFDAFQPSNGVCSAIDPTGSPQVATEIYGDPYLDERDARVRHTVTSLGRYLQLCILGFGEEVTVEVVRPDGTITTLSVKDVYYYDGIAYSFWTSVPGDAVGEHVVNASGGDVSATGTFTVLPAVVPDLLLAAVTGPDGSPRDYYDAPPGTTFNFALLGFEPGETVPLYLYGALDSPFTLDYLTELPSVTVGGDGTAYFDVVTDEGDTPGLYCVGIAARCAEFYLS